MRWGCEGTALRQHSSAPLAHWSGMSRGPWGMQCAPPCQTLGHTLRALGARGTHKGLTTDALLLQIIAFTREGSPSPVNSPEFPREQSAAATQLRPVVGAQVPHRPAHHLHITCRQLASADATHVPGVGYGEHAFQ